MMVNELLKFRKKFLFLIITALFFQLSLAPEMALAANTSSNQDNKRQLIVDTAKKYLGVKYVWGGTSPSGFDSSGFVGYVFKKNGIQLPRVSFDIYKFGKPISKKDLLPGDLVFFQGYRSGPSHGTIYIGDGKIIHSPSTGKTVSISNLNDPYYWGPRYFGALRIINSK